MQTGSLYKKDDLPYSIYKEKVEMLTKNLQCFELEFSMPKNKKE